MTYNIPTGFRVRRLSTDQKVSKGSKSPWVKSSTFDFKYITEISEIVLIVFIMDLSFHRT